MPVVWRTALLWLFLLGPVAGVVLAVVLAGSTDVRPTWFDLALAVVLFVITGHGITVGFHRYFTHSSFRASRGLKIALAIAGSLALEGDVTGWVATHRVHHAFADRGGDPHSPWRYGTGVQALTKGVIWAQVGWLFAHESVSRERWAADLVDDRDLQRINRIYPLWALLTILGPGVVGGLLTWSWTGALTALLWAGLARILLLHHMTWMVNSLCHLVGSRPFQVRDRSTNIGVLAVISLGDSWHNLHHAQPRCARHGVDPGQLDSSAAAIRMFERLGWADEVHWPQAGRLASRRSVEGSYSAQD